MSAIIHGAILGCCSPVVGLIFFWIFCCLGLLCMVAALMRKLQRHRLLKYNRKCFQAESPSADK